MSATGKRKLPYRWIAVISGAFIVFIAGNFQYTFGVFVKPLVDKFGWSRAAISGTVTIRSITSSLASPVAGFLGDRYGFKKLILIGIFLVGLGYLLTASITSLWQLYLYLGAFIGTGISLFFVLIISVATRWFGSKSALANGIIMSGFGWAQMIVPPLVTYLILQYSWETTCIILGIAVLALGTPALYFIRTPPDIAGQPSAEPEQPDLSGANETPVETEVNYTLPDALRTIPLWILFFILMMSAGTFQLVVIHIVIAAIDIGISPEAAAIILTLGGITNTSGRLVFGGLAAKIGNKFTLLLCLFIQAVALFFIAGAEELYVFYITVPAFALGYGGVAPVMPTIIGSFFGTRSIGSIYGVVNGAYTIGGALGPLLGGYIFDITGSYYNAFLFSAITMAVTFLLCLLLLKPPPRKAITA